MVQAWIFSGITQSQVNNIIIIVVVTIIIIIIIIISISTIVITIIIIIIIIVIIIIITVTIIIMVGLKLLNSNYNCYICFNLSPGTTLLLQQILESSFLLLHLQLHGFSRVVARTLNSRKRYVTLQAIYCSLKNFAVETITEVYLQHTLLLQSRLFKV